MPGSAYAKGATWRLDCSVKEADQDSRGAWVVCSQEGNQMPRVPTWFVS